VRRSVKEIEQIYIIYSGRSGKMLSQKGKYKGIMT
jgi:hypothetical protein